MRFTFRPLDASVRGNDRHRRSPFSAPWDKTRRLLIRELEHLEAENVAVQIDVDERDLRVDGTGPTARARVDSPTVAVSFDTRAHGPLRYIADEFAHWQDNVRAIALGLESLRRVDRYGITRRGEQYAGWRALPAGESAEVKRGRDLIREHGSVRDALMATHPDRGGDAADLRAIQAARDAG